MMQGQLFTIDFYVLPIEGPKVVLGYQWLHMLGRVGHDYLALSMEFTWQDIVVHLQGDVSLLPCFLASFPFINFRLGTPRGCSRFV